MNIINKLSTRALAMGLLVVALTLGVACSDQKGTDVFDKSPAERVDSRSAELAQRLVSSPNGWIMEYIPNKKAEYGGYIIGFKFNDKGQVLISSEALENTEEGAKEIIFPPIVSSYNIGRDVGVTLNFTDYNEALHYYSTPDRRYAADLGKGYEGDYEFRYMLSENPDELNFVGKKTGNKIRMYRAKEDAMEYVRKVVAMKRKLFSASEMLALRQDALVSTKPILGNSDLRLYYLTQEGYNYYNGKTSEYSELSVKLPFFYTPTGLVFFDPKTLEREAYTWNEGKRTLEREGGAVIEARDDPYYEGFASYLGDYQMVLTPQGGSPETYDVKFEQADQNLYAITGLPFRLVARYDTKHNRFSIEVQMVDNRGTALAAWNHMGQGRLTVSNGYGMYSQEVVGSNPVRYMMVDNGVWGSCDSFILWKIVGQRGEANDLYRPSRLWAPVFVRK